MLFSFAKTKKMSEQEEKKVQETQIPETKAEETEVKEGAENPSKKA